MTKVTFYQNSDYNIIGFEVKDHSGYAEEGEDIVCAGISMLVINTINSLESLTDDDFTVDVSEEPPIIRLEIEKERSDRANVLLESLKLGLMNLKEDETAANYIDIRFREV